MTDSTSSSAALRRQDLFIIAGLCLITASGILVEVCLTKFIAYKVYHHFVYAIISTVILSSGFAGVWTCLFPKRFSEQNPRLWSEVANASFLYAVTLAIATVVFCWLPIDPYMKQWPRLVDDLSQIAILKATIVPILTRPLGIYFFLFAIPFFFSGISVSACLSASRIPVSRIYAFDLFAAAIGAAICPWALENLGGYGTIALAAVLGMGAFASFFMAESKRGSFAALGVKALVFTLAAGLLLAYPGFARQKYGFDIRSSKNQAWQTLLESDFHGIGQTYWNAVARIDVSNTGRSRRMETFNYGANEPELKGRFILVDGAAPTRQLTGEGSVRDQAYLGKFLWGSPYVTSGQCKRGLVIGGGGGIDVLVAKFYKIPELDVVELNPSTYKRVLLGQDDPGRDTYQPWLSSDEITKVQIFNTEGRHFATSSPAAHYDSIQASCVDTLTAITSGALSMVENHLYTIDAVADYMRLLRPNGILSLTHWRLETPTVSLRMFASYLQYLDSLGAKEPYKHVVVVANEYWADEMVKAEPFTSDELKRIRQWAAKNDHVILFAPDMKGPEAGSRASEAVYYKIGFLAAPERKLALNAYPADVTPVTDDKPFFYKTVKSSEQLLSTEFYSSTPVTLVGAIFLISLILFSLPIFDPFKQRKEEAVKITPTILAYALCFCFSGFAFLVFETATIQSFGILVGGPVYSLSVVLVSVLAGYALGSWLSQKIEAKSCAFFILALVLCGVFASWFFLLHPVVHALLPLPLFFRISACAVITFALAALTGLPVSLAMRDVRARYGGIVSWMWGISCAANALGAMCFGLVAQEIGICSCFLIVSGFYFIAYAGISLLSAKVKTEA